MAEWIKELLVYAKMSDGIQKTILFNDIIRAVLNTFDQNLKDRNIKISMNQQEASPTIYATEAVFRQVITSLIANAVEAMPEGGELKITS
ncbi:MAG: hypothetical protein ACE5GK_12485 [Nitrospiria bacterium]